MKNLTLRHLRVFVAVARHLSFARAADDLALTGQAVSMQIKDLEGQIGLPLFNRSSRAVSLTRVGEQVLVYAHRVLAALRETEDMVASLKGLKGGHLDVATTGTADYFVPRLLTQFRLDHPQVEIRLQVMNNREQVAELLGRGDVELAIMGRPPAEWAVLAEPFAQNPQVLVTAVDHPFTRMTRVPPQALSNEAFIMREPGSGTREALDDYLSAHHLKVAGIMQMSSNEGIKQAVIAGMGISLVPMHTIGLELDHRLIAVPAVEGMPILRRWHIIRNDGRVLSPAAEAFRCFVMQEGEKFLMQYCRSVSLKAPKGARIGKRVRQAGHARL